MGERERIYETGFDEDLVGFSTREAEFSRGDLQSVTFARTDGSRVDHVRVIVFPNHPSVCVQNKQHRT
jgi:hypothetical protein